MDDLAARDAQQNLGALEELLRRLQGSLYDLSELLAAQHFSHLTLLRLPASS